MGRPGGADDDGAQCPPDGLRSPLGEPGGGGTAGPGAEADGTDVAGVDVARADAFARLVAEHGRSLFALAGGVVHDPDTAREIVARALAQVWFRPPVFRKRTPAAWLRKVVFNLATRTAKARSFWLGLDEIAGGRFDVSDRPGPEEEAIVRIEQSAIRAAVERLPRRMRMAVLLRDFGECSMSETAAEMGVSEGTVEKHLGRAYARLRLLLEGMRP